MNIWQDMVCLDRFLMAAKEDLRRDLSSNPEQCCIVSAKPDCSMKIVAGPGSGKTTVIVLRILEEIYCNDVDPSAIMATTFTRKAAKELKSRLLTWGETLRFSFLQIPDLGVKERERIRRLNFDAVLSGTIDSLSEEILTDHRQANENPPVIVDEIVARQLMIRRWFAREDLQDAIGEEFDKTEIVNAREFQKPDKAADNLINLRDRLAQNLIEYDSLREIMPSTIELLEDYDDHLRSKYFKDFPELEKEFLDFVSTERGNEFVDSLRMLVVDEYQDTNILQERIYLNLGRSIISKGGSMVVVGDDDQSIYRFRGSRVLLFSELEKRAKPYGILFNTKFLSINYRSTPSIVNFCNEYANLDASYQSVRISDKPKMTVGRGDCENFPIFGIFREEPEQLADDIARMAEDFTIRGSFVFEAEDGRKWTFERSPNGSTGDMVLLTPRPGNFNTSGNPKLPFFIRSKLNEHGRVKVFNPRGTEIYEIREVEILCGLLLECFDPESDVQNGRKMASALSDKLDKWRMVAKKYMETAPDVNGASLKDYVNAWQTGKPYNSGKWNKKTVPILDVVYNLIAWIPLFQSDAEGLVYLQAITDTISQSVHIDTHEASIEFDKKNQPQVNSVKSLLNNFLVPLADDMIDIDEDLLFSVNTRDRFNIMSIHQSKGLEFPITLIDVSSEFKINNQKQRKYRFPEFLDDTALMEKCLRNYSEEDWGSRDYLDQVFDGLIRLFFVGFSRAQDVLILVGLRDKKGVIKNMGTGWDRDGHWRWPDMGNIVRMR